MLDNQKYKHAGGSIFMSSMMGLANVIAVVATFFGTGPLYTKTVGWITGFAVQNYGTGSADIVSLVWGVICAALIFFIARASISTALVMGALAVAMRFF